MIKKVLLSILILIGIGCIAASVISMTVSTRLTVGNAFPAVTGILLIAYAIYRLIRRKPLFGNRILRIIATVIVCIGVLSFVAVQALIISYAHTPVPDDERNFVIVPGAGIFPDGRLTLTLKNRLDTAYGYLVDHENAVCMVTGSQGRDEPVAEAQAMKQYLQSRGIDPTRIVMEDRSFSTYENMQNASALMDELYPDKQKTAVIVTSDFHMYRSLGFAAESGMDAAGLSAPTPTHVVIPCYMREYLAVVNTWLFRVEI